MKLFLLTLGLALCVALAACEKSEPFDPLPAPGDQDLGMTPLGDKLYRDTTPEINSLAQRNQLPDATTANTSSWYRHKGRYYLKSQIL
jgi:hypothetical protein